MTPEPTFTFTQSKLDRIIGARIGAENAKHRAQLDATHDLVGELQAALSDAVAQLNDARAQLARQALALHAQATERAA